MSYHAAVTDGNEKGQAYMREVCLVLGRWAGGAFRPRPTIIAPSEGWAVKGDVQHAADVRFPFAVECKKIEGWDFDGLFEAPKWPVWKWWAQCAEQARTSKNTHPLLIFSRNRRKNYVLARASTLEWLKLRPVNGPLVGVNTPDGERLSLCLLDDLVSCPIPKSSRALG